MTRLGDILKALAEPAAVCPYGVGDVLVTFSAAKPADRWPGTEWEQVKDRFVYAAGGKAAGASGGQANHRHDYAAKTTHYYGGMMTSDADANDGFALWDFEKNAWVQGNVDRRQNETALTINDALTNRSAKANLGVLTNTKARSNLGTAPSDGGDYDILPPYVVAYMWKRTA